MGTKKTKKTPEVSLEALQAVAEEFNTFMFGEGEGIEIEDVEFDDLLKEVTEASEDLVAEDTISAETAEILENLGIEVTATISHEDEEPEEKKSAKKNGKKAAPKAEPEEDDSDEEADEEPEPEESEEDAAARNADIALVKKTSKIEKALDVAKAHGIPVPPPYRKDLAKLKTYLADKLSKPAVKKSPKVKNPAKEKSITARKTKPAGEKSNKLMVYEAFEKGKKKIEDLSKVVEGAVKDSTIKAWLGQWAHGKNLPAGVKSEK